MFKRVYSFISRGVGYDKKYIKMVDKQFFVHLNIDDPWHCS